MMLLTAIMVLQKSGVRCIYISHPTQQVIESARQYRRVKSALHLDRLRVVSSYPLDVRYQL